MTPSREKNEPPRPAHFLNKHRYAKPPIYIMVLGSQQTPHQNRCRDFGLQKYGGKGGKFGRGLVGSKSSLRRQVTREGAKSVQGALIFPKIGQFSHRLCDVFSRLFLCTLCPKVTKSVQGKWAIFTKIGTSFTPEHRGLLRSKISLLRFYLQKCAGLWIFQDPEIALFVPQRYG